MWELNPHCLTTRQHRGLTARPLSRRFGDPTVHPFPAGTIVGDPTVLAPPSLHVSWRSNGASLPCCVCPSLLPSRPCTLLHDVAFLPGPASGRVFPTRWRGEWVAPTRGTGTPLVPRRWLSLPCPSPCYTKANHNCSLPAVWLSYEPPIMPTGQARVRILSPPHINSTTRHRVSIECNICVVCICVSRGVYACTYVCFHACLYCV